MTNKKCVVLLQKGSLRNFSQEIQPVYITAADSLAIKLANYFVLEEFERDFPYFRANNHKNFITIRRLIVEIFQFNWKWNICPKTFWQGLHGFEMDVETTSLLLTAVQGGVSANFLTEQAFKSVYFSYRRDQQSKKDVSKFDVAKYVKKFKAYYAPALHVKDKIVKNLLQAISNC